MPARKRAPGAVAARKSGPYVGSLNRDKEARSMAMFVCSVRVGSRLLATALGLGVVGNPAWAQSETVPLAAHRAIYDLKLSKAQGKQPLQAVRGRIVYDFSGSACEGYGLQFRQVTELDNGEGKTAVSDLRSTTWEDGAAKSFRFNSQNYLNDELVDTVDGEADRRSNGVTVKLTKPQGKQFAAGSVSFPTEQMRGILVAARGGQSLLDLGIYDGSENGEKIYQSLTVIGRKILAEDHKPSDAAAGQAALDHMDRWPVTISYFDKSDKGGEQTPAYTISFELYNNGVSRALVLDYGDFAVSGEMTSLELKNTKPCH
jgi:EipB-like